MPQYAWKCRDCQREILHFFEIDADRPSTISCPRCGGIARRRFSFTKPAPFEDQYDRKAGRWITSKRGLEEEARRRSAEKSEKYGFEHDYTVHDARDPATAEHFGVTDEGLQATHDRAVEEGRKPATGKIVF